MQQEPAAIIAAIAAFANAAVGCIVAFGINWSQEQQNAILGVVAATTALIALLGPVIRQFVYSPKSTQELVNKAEQAGATNSPAPPVVP